jgi:5-methylcytosine-specific restriction endonuclease McrA
MRLRYPKHTDPFYTSKRWRAVRVLALRRDLYRCVICGADVSASGAARVDHIKERSNHPDLELDVDNLRTLCVLHDRHAHREKNGRPQAPGTERIVRFKLKGCDANGWPL